MFMSWWIISTTIKRILKPKNYRYMKRLFTCLLSAAVIASGCAILASCNMKAVEIIYEDPNLGNDENSEEGPQAAAKIDVSAPVYSISSLPNKITNITLLTNRTALSISPADADWYSTQFVGKQLVVTSILENTGAERRSQEVTVTAGEGDDTAAVTFTISQNTKADEKAEISVALDVFPINGKSGIVTRIPLITNQTVFSIDPATTEWYTSAFDGTQLVITTTQANETEAVRNQNVTVTAGEGNKTASVTFTLSQQIKPELDARIGRIHEGGIIYWVSDDKTTCRIWSLEDINKNKDTGWATSRLDYVGGGDMNDGRANVAIYKALPNWSDYTAAKGCDDKAPATEWWLPSRGELNIVVDAMREYDGTDSGLFIKNMMDAGADAQTGETAIVLTAYNWTSNEVNASPSTASCVRLSDKGGGNYAKDGKTRPTRCIRETTTPAL